VPERHKYIQSDAIPKQLYLSRDAGTIYVNQNTEGPKKIMRAPKKYIHNVPPPFPLTVLPFYKWLWYSCD
jgi:hypothetical protein